MPIKERRSYPRIEIRENVMFGEDKPVHNGKSENLSPEGMCIISDKVLPPKSNIKININIKHYTAENKETWENITVDGEVVWVDTPPGIYSKMGIKFKQHNDRLIQIYEAKASK